MDRPLWQNEDVTLKTWRIDSAEQLGCVVRHLAEFMLSKAPMFVESWSQLAMSMALSASNRHIAGRCFQIASALCQVSMDFFLSYSSFFKIYAIFSALSFIFVVSNCLGSWHFISPS